MAALGFSKRIVVQGALQALARSAGASAGGSSAVGASAAQLSISGHEACARFYLSASPLLLSGPVWAATALLAPLASLGVTTAWPESMKRRLPMSLSADAAMER